MILAILANSRIFMYVSANTIVETTNTTIVMSCETAGRSEVIETKVDEVVHVQETETEVVAGLGHAKDVRDPVRGQGIGNEEGIVKGIVMIVIAHPDGIVIENIVIATGIVIGIVTDEIVTVIRIVKEIDGIVPPKGKFLCHFAAVFLVKIQNVNKVCMDATMF